MPASTNSSRTDAELWAVVLAGGIGSRFWPVSTPRRPKQLLPLAGERALLGQAVSRIPPLVPLERVRILTGEALAAPILDALPELAPENLLLEPRARGTAPVLAWAAAEIARRDPDAVMLSLHADHVIHPEAQFRSLLAGTAALSAETGRLFTIGIAPDRPETGYGYIRPGPEIPGPVEAYVVDRFVEKPDRATAEAYVAEGYLWNSGIFVWPVRVLLEELRRHTPELAELLPLLDDGRIAEFFERAPMLTIDEGLLERSGRVGVARATFAWDDVGAWDAVARSRAADEGGNVAVGDSWLVDAQGCIAWADEGSVVVYGAADLVVVRANGITLVMPRERAGELKRLLGQLPERLRQPGGDGG